MSSEGLHEPPELLSEGTKNLHRAIVSLIEELEAVDWYNQRSEACSDPELKAVLVHNRNEEIEHAMMNLEWIRRTTPDFDQRMRTYLYSSGPITEVEEAQKTREVLGGPGGNDRGAPGGPAVVSATGGGGLLNVGSLRKG
jgi:ferritin-like protein